MTALNPCPFCGSIDGPELKIAERIGFSDAAHVFCRDCGATGPRAWRCDGDVAAINLKATEDWNRHDG